MGHLHRHPAKLPFQHEIDQEDYHARAEEQVNPCEHLAGPVELRLGVIRHDSSPP
jgi:hypothetical protein